MSVTITIAPDSFKGTASAAEVAGALERGWRTVRPSDSILKRPMADGGEGSLDAFALSRPQARRMPIRVSGPTGTPVAANWLRYRDQDDALTGFVELASTSGITLLDRLDPWHAHTRGFGQAISAALSDGVERLVLAVGGSCSTDGGAGMLNELGMSLLDSTGSAIADGCAGLRHVARVDANSLLPLPSGGATVLTDVTNPLLGNSGAAAVFGPQKGFTPAGAIEANAALRQLSELMPRTPATAPGAGAAGGTGFALLHWGARLVPGSTAVADEIGLADAIAASRVVLTGEGRFDGQSESGKVPTHVRDLAARHGALVGIAAGSIEAATTGFGAAASLTEIAGSSHLAMRAPIPALEQAGAALATALDPLLDAE